MTQLDERENHSVYDLRDAEMYTPYLVLGSIGPAVWTGVGYKSTEGWVIQWWKPEGKVFQTLQYHVDNCGVNGQTEPEIFAFSPAHPAYPLRYTPKRMKIMQELRDAGVIDENNKEIPKLKGNDNV